jgi:hypothetical protein
MAARGYNWSQVHYVNDADVTALPVGDPLS